MRTYIVTQTNPKRGLPHGAWKCTNPEKKFRQSFGANPTEALENYITSELEN